MSFAFPLPSLSQNSSTAGSYRTTTQMPHPASVQDSAALVSESQQQSLFLPPFSQSHLLGNYCMTQPAAVPSAAAVARRPSNNPATTIARQKARYARSYVPPPGLSQSQLNMAAEEVSTQDASGHSQYREKLVGTHPQPVQRSAHVRYNPEGGSYGKTTAVAVPVVSAAQTTGECIHLLLVMQERQLECWQQLALKQQELAFELRGLRADLRCVCEKLTEKEEQVVPRQNKAEAQAVPSTSTPSHKRCRTQREEESRTNTKAEHAVNQRCCHPSSSQRLKAVHSVRLIGSSAASTQAFAPDDAGTEPEDQPHTGAALPKIPSSDVDNRASDAADSEADLFLL